MTVMSLPLSGIREDFSFRFSSGHASEALVRSVREGGIRTPLFAVSQNGEFCLLSGFKRHDAAVFLGFKSVPAMLVPEDSCLLSAFRDVLLEQSSIRNFSLMEKARTLGILDRMGVDWERLRSDFLQVLEIPCRKETADEIRSLLGLSEAVRRCIEVANFTLAQANCFHLFSSQGQDLLADWAIRLRLGGVELAEIAESVADISVRDRVPAEEWLAGSDCEALVQDNSISRSEKIGRIKAELFRRRFPTLDSLNRSMEEFRASLDLPSNVRIRWDPSFEQPGFVLEARIRDREDITRLAGRLADPHLGDKWKKPFPNP